MEGGAGVTTNSHPAKMECGHLGAQGELFGKERKTATHPDGRRPDPGGHPHGRFCASRGWRQDPRAAGRERNVKEAVFPPLPPPRGGEPPAPHGGRVRGRSTRRDSFPHGAPGSRLPRPAFPTRAIRSGRCSKSGPEGARLQEPRPSRRLEAEGTGRVRLH